MASSSGNVESTRNGMDGQIYPQPLAIHVAVVNNRTLFFDTLIKFLQSMGTKFYVPEIDGCCLDLHLLYVQVTNRGGYEKVVAYKRWKEVSLAFMFSSAATSVSFVLKKHYSRLLYHYEQVYFFCLVNNKPSNNNSSGCEDNLTRGIDTKFDGGYITYMVTAENDSQEDFHGVMYQGKEAANANNQSPTIQFITTTTHTDVGKDIVTTPSYTSMYALPTIVSSSPTQTQFTNATLASEPLTEAEIVLSLAPPPETVTYAPPPNAGSNSTITQSIITTLKTPTNASSLFLARPSNTKTYVPPAIVARNFTKCRFHSITTPSKPPTKAISSPSLTPPSNTMIYAPPTNEGSNTTKPELPINVSSDILAPVPDTMMYARPATVSRSSAKFRFSSTNITPKPNTKETTLSLAPAPNTMVGAPPTNAGSDTTSTRSNNIIISGPPPTKANSLPLVPVSNTMMSPPPTNAGSSNSAATKSNITNISEQQTEAPEPKRKRSSGYTYYLTKKQAELRASHPNTRMGKITKMAGKAWTKMTKEDKMAYHKMAMEDRERC